MIQRFSFGHPIPTESVVQALPLCEDPVPFLTALPGGWQYKMQEDCVVYGGILLAGQTLLIFLFTYFVIFNIMGRDYDAAVIAAGVCGFGMGATPNAMANMQALCEKYAPSVKAYLLIPLVGSLFADFLNSLVITFFINFI